MECHDEYNHSVFDFPNVDQSFSEDERACSDGGGTDRGGGGGGGRRRRKRSGRRKKKAAGGDSPTASRSLSPTAHPYPSSISIQMSGSPLGKRASHRGASPRRASPRRASPRRASPRRASPRRASPKRDGEFRSPFASPRGRDVAANREARQSHSPLVERSPGARGYKSELTRQHQAGLRHFRSNRLSESVESYSLALRAGLRDLTHRKDIVARMMGGAGSPSARQDDLLMELGRTLARVHTDMGAALEVAQKFEGAKAEWENGMGMLLHTCEVGKGDRRVKQLRRDIGRMDRAITVEDERRERTSAMADALARLERDGADEATGAVADSAVRRLMRTERDSLGERSHAYAKLNLKLARVKCRAGDLEAGLRCATSAVATLKEVLGDRHALVGAACLFTAAAYEKWSSSLSELAPAADVRADDQAGEGVKAPTSECLSMMEKALELYADALEPLRLKYESLDGATQSIHPDVGEVLLKMGRLYSQMGSVDPAKDAYRRSLEAYGDCEDGSKERSKSKIKNERLHSPPPEASVVWLDLAVLHLRLEEYNDAARASGRSLELAERGLKGGAFNEKLEVIISPAHRIAGDAYAKLGMSEDAMMSYGRAYTQLKKVARSPKIANANAEHGPFDEARLLGRMGALLFQLGRFEDARAHLTDAVRTMHSTKGRETSPEMPGLLCDLGQAHTKLGKYPEAMDALQACLKMQADRGVSDRSPAAERARALLEEARRGPTREEAKAFSLSPSVRNDEGKTVSALPDAAETPLSQATMPTFASSGGFLSGQYGATTGSAGSGRGQLQTLLEELEMAEGGDRDGRDASSPSKSTLSPLPLSVQSTAPSAGGNIRKDCWVSAPKVGSEGRGSRTAQRAFGPGGIDAIDRKRAMMVEEMHEYEVRRFKRQLEDAVEDSRRCQLRLKEVEAERDKEKRDKVLAAAAHRKEIDALMQTNSDKDAIQAETKAEMETLQSELNASESLYQELVNAIDKEKERTNVVHEGRVKEMQTKVDDLQKETRALRGKLKGSGAVENDRLSESLAARNREIQSLREQGLKSSQEIASLKSTNLSLRSERDSASREASAAKSKNEQLQADNRRLSSELTASKISIASKTPNNVTSMDIKKLEFELQSERSRRMILESSLQKEYDRGDRGDKGGSSGGGVYTYPMPHMPFGYPSMHIASPHPPPSNNSNENNARIKTLEIDLATEQANRGMLENVINEMRNTHEQEKESLQAQYASVIATHERQSSEMLTEIGTKEEEVDRVTHELNAAESAREALSLRLEDTTKSLSQRLEDTTDELRDMKEQLSQTSCGLSTATEENMRLVDTVSILESAKKELEGNIKSLRLKGTELEESLKKNTESVHLKDSELNKLKEDHGRLKREYHEAVTLFESEMNRANEEKREVEETLAKEIESVEQTLISNNEKLGGEVTRLQSDLSAAKIHLKNVLCELEGVCLKNGELEADAKDSKLALDNARKEIGSKKEELQQAIFENGELSASCKELEEKITELEGMIAAEKQARDDKECELEQSQRRLVTAEDTIEKLNEKLHESMGSFGRERIELETRLKKLLESNKKYDMILRSIPQKLEDILPGNVSTKTPDADECRTDSLQESVASRVSQLLLQIENHNSHLNAVIKSRDETLEKTQWNLSNSAHDLDKVELKNKLLREELENLRELKDDYDELLKQYETEIEEKEATEKRHKANIIAIESKSKESLLEAQRERDLFESQLKEAVDDLEELERERNSLRVQIDHVRAKSVEKRAEFADQKRMLDNRIAALEVDNNLIAKLESQALEYEAALSENAMRLERLEEELIASRVELDEVQINRSKVSAELLETEERLKKKGEELEMARSDLDRAQCDKTEIAAKLVESEQRLEEAGQDLQHVRSELDNIQNDRSKSSDKEESLGLYEKHEPDELSKCPSEFYQGTVMLNSGTQTEEKMMPGSNAHMEEASIGRQSPIENIENDIFPNLWSLDERSPSDICSDSDGLRSMPMEVDNLEVGGPGNVVNPDVDIDQKKERKPADLRSPDEKTRQAKESSSFGGNSSADVEMMELGDHSFQERGDSYNRDDIEIAREKQAMLEEIQDLRNYIQALEEATEASREEIEAAAVIHDNDCEAIMSLQRDLDERSEFWKNRVNSLEKELKSKQHYTDADVALLEEEITSVKSQLDVAQEKQCRSMEQMKLLEEQVQERTHHNEELSTQLAQSETKAAEAAESLNNLEEELRSKQNSVYTDADVALLEEEISSAKSKLLDEEEKNVKLSSQLKVAEGETFELIERIKSLKHQVQVFNKCNVELSSQLAQSEAKAGEATKTQKDTEALELELCRKQSMVTQLEEEISASRNQHQALEDQIRELRSRLETVCGEQDASTEQIKSLQDLVQTLEHRNEELSTQLASLGFKATEAARTSGNEESIGREFLCNLMLEGSNESDSVTTTGLLEEEISALKNQLFVVEDQAAIPETTHPEQDISMEKVELLEDQVKALKHQNEEISVKLAHSQEKASNTEKELKRNCAKIIAGLKHEIATWKSKIEVLEQVNQELRCQLGKLNPQTSFTHSESNRQLPIVQIELQNLQKENKKLKCDIELFSSTKSGDRGKYNEELFTQLAQSETKGAIDAKTHENDQAALIEELRQTLNEKEQEHQHEVGNLMLKVSHLNDSNQALERELSELTFTTEDHTECNEKLSSLQMSLQNAINEYEERQIQQNLELAAIKAEFHNTTNSLDELQKENQKLKGDIESLSVIEASDSTVKTKNFEKEMNAAHSRFVSMEKALQGQVLHLEKENEKLVAEFNAEITKKDDEHAKTKIEVSAWKLEMQNALNDIEALKKERDELKAQVSSYITSLEAVCMGKAELEEKIHNLKAIN